MSMLTEGDSSRLHRLLVEEKKLAIEVGGYFPGRLRSRPHVAAAHAARGRQASPKSRRRSMRRSTQVVAQGVTDAELARAKNLYASSFWKQLATINGKASLLGQFEVFEGDYRKLFDSPAVYDKVTREDVQKAAALVFQKNRRTVGVLEAKPMKRRASESRCALRVLGAALALPACCRGRRGRQRRGGREGAGQPALRAAERPHHRARAQERRAAHRVQRFRARRRARRSGRQGRRGLAGRGPAGSRRGQAQRLSNSPMRSKAWAAASTPARVRKRFRSSGQFLARDRALHDRAAGGCAHASALRGGGVRELPRSRDRVHQVGQGFRSFAAHRHLRPRRVVRRASLRPAAGRQRAHARDASRKAMWSRYHAAHFGADRATLVFAGDLDPKWMRQALTTAFGGWAKAQGGAAGAQARAARHGPPRVARRFARFRADLFLARQRRASTGATAAGRRSIW